MKPDTARIRRFLKSQIGRNRRLHQAQSRGEGPLEWVAKLRTWQAQRLTDSFADLHASERYGEAMKFFINDLYTATGFEQRDEELERIEPILVRLLPAHLIETTGRAMELQALSEELDIALARVLERDCSRDTPIDVDIYAHAYRECNNRLERSLQIDLLNEIGSHLDWVVTKPYIYAALVLCRGPARAAGLGALQTFLENAFRAYRSMNGATWFLETITSRERQVMENLFAGRADPFAVTIEPDSEGLQKTDRS